MTNDGSRKSSGPRMGPPGREGTLLADATGDPAPAPVGVPRRAVRVMTRHIIALPSVPCENDGH